VLLNPNCSECTYKIKTPSGVLTESIGFGEDYKYVEFAKMLLENEEFYDVPEDLQECIIDYLTRAKLEGKSERDVWFDLLECVAVKTDWFINCTDITSGCNIIARILANYVLYKAGIITKKEFLRRAEELSFDELVL